MQQSSQCKASAHMLGPLGTASPANALTGRRIVSALHRGGSLRSHRHGRAAAPPASTDQRAAAAAPEGGGGDSSSSSSNVGGSEHAGLAAVQIEYRGLRLQAERGATLRTALLLAGVTPHNGRAALINCRGLGTCGTCAVEVAGPVDPPHWTPQERLRLSFPPHAPPGNRRLRLACQVACQGDLAVTKRQGFWGQHEGRVPDLPAPEGGSTGGGSAAAPLGQLEYVLDRRRRRTQQPGEQGK